MGKNNNRLVNCRLINGTVLYLLTTMDPSESIATATANPSNTKQ